MKGTFLFFVIHPGSDSGTPGFGHIRVNRCTRLIRHGGDHHIALRSFKYLSVSYDPSGRENNQVKRDPCHQSRPESPSPAQSQRQESTIAGNEMRFQQQRAWQTAAARAGPSVTACPQVEMDGGWPSRCPLHGVPSRGHHCHDQRSPVL